MFKKGDIYIGKYEYKACALNGKIQVGNDRQQMEILDVKDNIFTVRFYYNWDNVTRKYKNNAIGIGLFNKRNKTFHILETLNEQPIVNLVVPPFDITLVKGKYNSNKIYINLLEAVNNEKGDPNKLILFSLETYMYKQ